MVKYLHRCTLGATGRNHLSEPVEPQVALWISNAYPGAVCAAATLAEKAPIAVAVSFILAVSQTAMQMKPELLLTFYVYNL